MRKLTSVLAAIVIIAGLFGACGGQDVEENNPSPEVEERIEDTDGADQEQNTDQNEESPGNGNQNAEDQAGEEGAGNAQVGDTLNVDGAKITITGIEKFTGTINEFSPLEQDHAVKIDVIVENTNEEQFFVDALEFKLYDADGFEVQHALPSDEMELSGEIPAGKKIQGSLFFDVPAQEGTWELHYESLGSFGGDPAIWDMPAT
ncbi:DUF4352 domain-containing protein [Marinicrinis lubricantis]|uniref:DUF4352 domain-containing protein n=1 Tax=Marinicrinis lubricantis TaxID=2086470 RepID=A0ABW1IJ39_9BACL